MGQVVQFNCPVRLLYCPVLQRLQAMVSVDCSTRLLYLPVPQSLQLVMSSSTVDPYCPTGQASQAVAFENGVNVGFAMNVPGEQHPKRPVDPVDEENARDQHNVCVKALLKNTLQKIRKKRVRIVIR